jgi:hypothetical protein
VSHLLKEAQGMTGEDHVEQVLKGPLLNLYKTLGKEWSLDVLLIEDGAGLHWRKSTQAARKALGIHSLPHPHYSSDLNPIEPLWLLPKNSTTDIPGSGNSLDKL